jgi:hypothetical protein
LQAVLSFFAFPIALKTSPEKTIAKSPSSSLSFFALHSAKVVAQQFFPYERKQKRRKKTQQQGRKKKNLHKFCKK